MGSESEVGSDSDFASQALHGKIHTMFSLYFRERKC